MTLWRCWGRFKMIFLEGLNEKLEELNGKGLEQEPTMLESVAETLGA
jgi:hypothetical protein